MYNRYSHSKLINHIYANLPMDEFVKGNFSRAGEIVDEYKQLLEKCIQETSDAYLSGKTMKEYLNSELSKLLEEKEKLESELKEVLDKIDEIKKISDELKKEKKGSKKWEAIRKKFKEMNWDIGEFEDFLDAVKKSNPDNYKQGEEEINEFLNSTNYEKIKKRHQENNMRSLKSKRNEIVRKLNHKGNTMNAEQQIDDIEKGRYQGQLEKNIEKDVKKFFGKIDEFRNRYEDQRSMMDLYIEIINSRIILNKNIDEKLRREFIRKFQDKFGLWEYIWDIYQELMIRNMEIKDSMIIEGEIDSEEKIKKTLIEEIGYWIDFCRNNYHMWWEKLEEDDIKYLEEKINGEKKHGRDMTKLNDDRLKKIFKILKDYFEDAELENKFEITRNYLYQGISLDTKRLKVILIDLFKYMSQEDKKDIIERYGYWNAFKEIEERSKIENNQLELFNYNTSYISLELDDKYKEILGNMKGYIENKIKDGNIEFTNIPHITLDFIGLSEVERASEKLKKLKGNLNEEIIASIKTIELGKFESFVSDINGKRVFYLDVKGGELFFDFLRQQGYSIRLPHLKIFETTSRYGKKSLEKLLHEINNDPELSYNVRKLKLNLNNFYLRGNKKEILDVLEI